MQQLSNPSHVDRGRIVVPAALVSGIVAGWAAWAVVPRLAFFGAFALGALVCIGVAWFLGRWLERRALVRTAAALQMARDAETAATEDALARRAKAGTRP